ncbi:hypothetical protein KP003_16700 [Geomonas nitrogeniifigens]|uniref:hypothetical protein n=1 Tax=Geomonas diazotrophica TaxID=2843197 RepID=UPI001C2CC1D0|nr:hypothetical protein [Geomonas nitrogeniifigens]QXE85981.1 hypothetical protein KP003_16700 [Geomonas nitrogeniifigens]
MPDVCQVHEQEVKAIHELASNFEKVATNVEWIKKAGTWWMGFTGAALVMLIPLCITFAVYVSNIDKRLSVVEQQLGDHVGAPKR